MKDKEQFLVRMPNGVFVKQNASVADVSARKPDRKIYLLDRPADLGEIENKAADKDGGDTNE